MTLELSLGLRLAPRVNWNFLPAPHYHHFSRNNNALQSTLAFSKSSRILLHTVDSVGYLVSFLSVFCAFFTRHH